MKSKKKTFLVIGFVIFFAIFLRIFVGEPCYIPSGSMEPTILVGDWLWINKSSYGSVMPNRWSEIPLINVFTWNSKLRKMDMETDWGYHRTVGWRSPKFDDIIIFKSPEDKKVLLIKRIAEWLPKGTVLTIDQNNYQRYKSILVQEGKRTISDDTLYIKKINNSYKLKSAYCFVLGDNRPVARDSRSFGYICETNIIGKVSGVLFSTKDITRFLQKLE